MRVWLKKFYLIVSVLLLGFGLFSMLFLGCIAERYITTMTTKLLFELSGMAFFGILGVFGCFFYCFHIEERLKKIEQTKENKP